MVLQKGQHPLPPCPRTLRPHKTEFTPEWLSLSKQGVDLETSLPHHLCLSPSRSSLYYDQEPKVLLPDRPGFLCYTSYQYSWYLSYPALTKAMSLVRVKFSLGTVGTGTQAGQQRNAASMGVRESFLEEEPHEQDPQDR